MNRRKAIRTITISAVAGMGLFSGYKWYDWNKSPDIEYLTGNKRMITALAETIIPADATTPGATEAHVADYIILMIRDCTDRRSTNKFIEGLKAVAHRAQSRYNKDFESCTPIEQQAVLAYIASKPRAQPLPIYGQLPEFVLTNQDSQPVTLHSFSDRVVGKAQNRYLGRSFFTTLKQYTAEGYCSSEAGATRGLAYVPVPGSFRGCVPLQPGQPAWATH